MFHIQSAMRQLLAVLALALPYSCQGEELALEKQCLRDTNSHCDLYGSWLKSKGVLYIQAQGKIYTVNLRSTKRELLVDHGLKDISTFELAPRGDHILYSGTTQQNDTEVYIYNTKYGAGFKMPGVGSVEFSPNAQYAVQVNMQVPAVDKHLFLVNLEAGGFQTSVLPTPIDVATLGDYRQSEVKWALDSRKFYLGMLAFPERAELRNPARQREIDRVFKARGLSGFSRYFVFDLSTKRLTRIRGRFVPNGIPMTARDGLHYIENGKEVRVYSRRR
jgi:hypothetical protein